MDKDNIITLYKVECYFKYGARVESERFRVTAKSYVPVDTTYSKLGLGKHIPKGKLERLDLTFTIEEAVNRAMSRTKEAIRKAQINLQRAEERLNEIEQLAERIKSDDPTHNS